MGVWSWRAAAGGIMLATVTVIGGAEEAVAATPAPAPVVAPGVPSPGEIVARAPKGDWVEIAPDDLMVMELGEKKDGASTLRQAQGSTQTGGGNGTKQVVIQLMPPPFSQGWVGNIRKLVAARWYDGVAVTRVQDNYVAQWGDPNGEDKARRKPLPAGLVTVPEREYAAKFNHDTVVQGFEEFGQLLRRKGMSHGLETPPPPPFDGPPSDNYAAYVGFQKGWPVGSDYDFAKTSRWPIHCYGMVGVGRALSPDTGTGAELYTVIGHAPRHLDRNIALVGRVVAGIEQLSSLPRGTGPLGAYETPEERVPVVRVRMMSELPPGERVRYEYLSTESASFARYADARANRRDAFFIRPAGGADICNVPVPVRVVR